MVESRPSSSTGDRCELGPRCPKVEPAQVRSELLRDDLLLGHPRRSLVHLTFHLMRPDPNFLAAKRKLSRPQARHPVFCSGGPGATLRKVRGFRVTGDLVAFVGLTRGVT
jgi:hypothetical protein